MVSYEKEVDIDNKLNNYLKIAGIINNVFRSQKTLKVRRIKLYSTLALPALLYGSENWIITARNKKNNSSKDEVYGKNSGMHLDGL